MEVERSKQRRERLTARVKRKRAKGDKAQNFLKKKKKKENERKMKGLFIFFYGKNKKEKRKMKGMA